MIPEAGRCLYEAWVGKRCSLVPPSRGVVEEVGTYLSTSLRLEAFRRYIGDNSYSDSVRYLRFTIQT